MWHALSHGIVLSPWASTWNGDKGFLYTADHSDLQTFKKEKTVVLLWKISFIFCETFFFLHNIESSKIMYTIFPFGVNLFPLTNKFMKSYQSNKLNPFWSTNSNGMEKQEWLKILTYWPIQRDCFAVKNYIILLHHTLRLYTWTSFDHMWNRRVLSNILLLASLVKQC